MRIHTNNLATTTTLAISASATSIIVSSSTGFPTLGSNTMNMTLSAGAVYEIVKVTARSSTTLTVVRAQEGTTAVAWPAGTAITCNVTRDSVDNRYEYGDETSLTIASGAITITGNFHRVDTESSAATDDLDTINGGTTGKILVIKANNGARDVVAKDGTGNLRLAGDMTLDNTQDTLTLIYSTAESAWLEIARSNNGL